MHHLHLACSSISYTRWQSIQYDTNSKSYAHAEDKPQLQPRLQRFADASVQLHAYAPAAAFLQLERTRRSHGSAITRLLRRTRRLLHPRRPSSRPTPQVPPIGGGQAIPPRFRPSWPQIPPRFGLQALPRVCRAARGLKQRVGSWPGEALPRAQQRWQLAGSPRAGLEAASWPFRGLRAWAGAGLRQQGGAGPLPWRQAGPGPGGWRQGQVQPVRGWRAGQWGVPGQLEVA